MSNSAQPDERSMEAAPDERGNTPLHLVMERCSRSTSPSRKTSRLFLTTESTPSLVAEEIKAVKEALAIPNLDVNHQNESGSTALHIMFQGWHHHQPSEEVVCFFLKECTRLGLDLDLNLTDQNGFSPLIEILRRHAPPNLGVMEALLDAGADINLPNPKTGDTPLHVAVRNQRDEAVKFLLSHGSKKDLNTWNNEGNTPLLLLEYREPSMELVVSLLEAGLDVNNSNPRTGTTPLHLAVNWGPEIVQLLLANGASKDVGTQNVYGNTPLHETSNPQIAKLLLDSPHGVDCIGKSNIEGDTPLTSCIYGVHKIRLRLEVAPMAKLILDATPEGVIHKSHNENFDFFALINDIVNHEEDDSSRKLHFMVEYMQMLAPLIRATKNLNLSYLAGAVLWKVMKEFCGESVEELMVHINRLLELGADINFQMGGRPGFSTLHLLLQKGRQLTLFHGFGEAEYEYEYDDMEFIMGFCDERCENHALWPKDFRGIATIADMEDTILRVLNHLMEARQDINLRIVTKRKLTLLHFATLSGHERVATRILQIAQERDQPLDVSAPDTSGMTPLHLACRKKNPSMVKWLVAKGASLLAVAKGKTPWEMVATRYHCWKSKAICAELSVPSNLGPTKALALNIVKSELGQPLAGRILKHLWRAGPAGKALTFELLPVIMSSQAKAAGKKRFHSEV